MDGFAGRPQDHLGRAITVSIAEITNDPHRKVQEPDAELVGQLVGGGRFDPLLVTRSSSGRLMLLGGEKRFLAYQAVGRASLRVYVAHTKEAFAAWLELDGKQSPMVASEVATLSSKAIFQLRLAGKAIGQTDAIIGQAYGFAAKDIQDTRQLINRLATATSDQDRYDIQADMEMVDKGLLRPSSAISRLVLRAKKAENAANASPPSEQEKTLVRALPTLAGTVEALVALGPISPGVPVAVRIKAEKQLRNAYRALATIGRSLKKLNEESE